MSRTKPAGEKPLGVSNFETYASTLANTTEPPPLNILGFDIVKSDDFDDLSSFALISDSSEESSNGLDMEVGALITTGSGSEISNEIEDSFIIGNAAVVITWWRFLS